MSRPVKPSQRLKVNQRVPHPKHVQTDAQPEATSLLKDQQVMSLLGISRTGLHYLMRKQGLPYIKLGEGSRAALRFNEQSLQVWLKQHEQQAVS
jgi:predicted DNA-binding transcriptional regulator AlpA